MTTTSDPRPATQCCTAHPFLDIVIGLLEVANAIAQLALDAAKGVVQAVAALVTFGLDLLKSRLISTYHMPFHIG